MKRCSNEEYAELQNEVTETEGENLVFDCRKKMLNSLTASTSSFAAMAPFSRFFSSRVLPVNFAIATVVAERPIPRASPDRRADFPLLPTLPFRDLVH